MRNRLLFVVSIMLITSMIACQGGEEDLKIKMFNEREGTRIGREYMNKLSEGEKNFIHSFKLNHSVEGANYVYLNYKVIRGSDSGSSIGLDSFDLKVVKNEEVYSVEEVKSKNTKQIYVDNNTLRIREEEVGNSQLFLRNKDLPKEIYSKGSKLMINKYVVPVGEFSMLSLGFDGNKVALVIKNENEEFLALALVKESKATVAKTDGEDSNKIDSKDVNELLEKPIVEKIIPYDLFEDSEVEKIMFSNDDGELIVQINSDGISRIRCYKNSTGELMPIDLETKFPRDKYHVRINRVNEEGSFIKVTPLVGGAEEEYILDLKEMKVTKMIEE